MYKVGQSWVAARGKKVDGGRSVQQSNRSLLPCVVVFIILLNLGCIILLVLVRGCVGGSVGEWMRG